MSDSKKCPFCGGEAKICHMQTDNMAMVACNGCHAHSALFLTEEEAVDAWNRRDNDG